MTNNEQAAIACDLMLMGLVKLEMIGDSWDGGSKATRDEQKARAVQLLSGWVDEYANDANLRRDDRMRLDVLRRVLAYLEGKD